MGKKKDKNQPITHIHNLNLEIDYDKLAEAIVAAQEKVTSDENRGKKYTSAALASVVAWAFLGVSLLGCIAALFVPLYVSSIWHIFRWDGYESILSSVLTIILYVGIEAVVILYSVVLWKAAKEISAEKNRNYIIALFSGVVSFAALIVALVALVKG